MKLRDVLETEQQLDEISLKQAIAAGMIGATAVSAPRTLTHAEVPNKPAHVQMIKRDLPQSFQQHLQQSGERDQEEERLVQLVLDKYKVPENLAAEIVAVAHKYEHDDFPTAKDILAVVGVESSFRPDVTSPLKRDPARGLMQIRPGVWDIDPEELDAVESNIQHGARILRHYYEKLGNPRSAVQAYNVGITNYRKGTKNPRYLQKYQSEYRRLAADDT